MFARIFMEHFPLLPVEEEGRLHDSVLRENFIERVFVFRRWRELLAATPRLRDLAAFHTRQKLLILSHSTTHYRELGRLVAQAHDLPAQELFERYQSRLMEALRLKATPKKNVNVLYHLMGYFKKDLSPDEKQELLEVLDACHQGHVPLVVPITSINHYVCKYHRPYLQEQFYLHPHPAELRLRNLV
jgi:uncharacterized protein YbgA (DUF1722 family)